MKERASPRITRRQFLTRAGALGFGTALVQLPAALRGKGWLDEAAARIPTSPATRSTGS